jgi:hypothetical protein
MGTDGLAVSGRISQLLTDLLQEHAALDQRIKAMTMSSLR